MTLRWGAQEVKPQDLPIQFYFAVMSSVQKHAELKIIGANLPSTQDLQWSYPYISRGRKQTENITADPSHPSKQPDRAPLLW